MWLARRPGVTAGMAREWYGALRCVPLKRQIRRFTGRVSQKAADAPLDEQLHREHHLRMRMHITKLVERHLAKNINDADEFVQTVVALEEIDIVTKDENIALKTAEGDHLLAGVSLIMWSALPPERQEVLWLKMIRNHVVNAVDFDPRPPHPRRRVTAKTPISRWEAAEHKLEPEQT